jgi:DNA processing protein
VRRHLRERCDTGTEACPACLRRAWLLQQLSARLAYHAREPERLLHALTLEDEQLIQALGGRRRQELIERHARFERTQLPPTEGVRRICRHGSHYPPALRRADAPPMLHVAGGAGRMRTLLAEPAVAIVGTRRASDYGMETAYGLARGIAASGLTVVSGFAEGIAAAAHQGALRAGGRTVTVMAGGVDVASPASWRTLHRRIVAEGCALAELPCSARPRGWCNIARARTVVALARIVIVVEEDNHPAALLHARLAAAADTAIAAVPGRVSAPAARGPHQLLREGALLVDNPQDVLDAVYGVGERQATVSVAPHNSRLQVVLDQVSAGNDTVAKLTAGEVPTHEVLLALAQLECAGAVARGDGGRYVACL